MTQREAHSGPLPAGALAAAALVASEKTRYVGYALYGLGANALDQEAVARVFRVKGRAESKPLLILVDSVRMAESFALALVRAAGFPVTAPSVNPSGAVPPTRAEEAKRFLDGKIELILDGGPTAGGRPSTVLDLSVSPPRLIRAGAVKISSAVLQP